jgi:hypothetical protein
MHWRIDGYREFGQDGAAVLFAEVVRGKNSKFSSIYVHQSRDRFKSAASALKAYPKLAPADWYGAIHLEEYGFYRIAMNINKYSDGLYCAKIQATDSAAVFNQFSASARLNSFEAAENFCIDQLAMHISMLSKKVYH